MAARSEASTAINSVPSATKWTGCPDASSRARANAGQARAAATLRAVRASSPKWASPTGASMPAAAQLAPRPGRGSTRVTVMPRGRRLPGDGQSDDAAPDHDDVRCDRVGHGPMLRAVPSGRRPEPQAWTWPPPAGGPSAPEAVPMPPAARVQSIGPHMGQRRPGWVDPLPSLERPDDDSSPNPGRRPSHRYRGRPAAPAPPTRRPPEPPMPRSADSTTLGSSTTPAGSPWWPTSTAVGRTPWSARRSPPSSTWPTGGPPAARRTAATAPGSSSRSPTTSTSTRSTSNCPPAATTPPASPSCPVTPTRPPTPAGRRQAGRRGGARRPRLAHRAGRRPTRWVRSPRRPCRRCTSSSWPRRRAPSLHRRRPGPGHRPPGLRAAQAGRARDRRLLLRLAVGPDHHLQGDAHLPPAGRLLPRPVRRAGDQRPGPGALPLLHQHLPVVAAGPSLPVPGPQRRDQHPGRQPQLDAGPRSPVPRPT